MSDNKTRDAWLMAQQPTLLIGDLAVENVKLVRGATANVHWSFARDIWLCGITGLSPYITVNALIAGTLHLFPTPGTFQAVSETIFFGPHFINAGVPLRLELLNDTLRDMKFSPYLMEKRALGKPCPNIFKGQLCSLDRGHTGPCKHEP